LKKFLPAWDRQGGWVGVNIQLVLRIAFQRNGEFFSRHVFLDDELSMRGSARARRSASAAVRMSGLFLP
jgi:hypothetical protein